MKRILSLLLILTLAIAAVGCAAQPKDPQPDPAPKKDYTAILTEARNKEDNDYMEVIGKDEDGKLTLTHNPMEVDKESFQGTIDMTFEMMSLDVEMMEDMAISSSLMNISAYSIAIVKPAEGKEEAVRKALEGYVELQQKSFENYLPNQYEVTKAAKVETMKTGEIVLVMAEDSDNIMGSIRQALEK